jgi:6-phospho-3-hexuloisomerase
MSGAPASSRLPWLVVGGEVRDLLLQIDQREFESVVTELDRLDGRWFFSGQGRSGLVAKMIAMRFMHLGRQAHVPGEATAPSIRKGDGLVLVSGSGETQVSVLFAGIAKNEGARTVVVTHEPQSILARLGDVVLTIPARDSVQLGGSLFEQAALLVLDAAVLAISGEQAAARRTLAYLHANLQ